MDSLTQLGENPPRAGTQPINLLKWMTQVDGLRPCTRRVRSQLR